MKERGAALYKEGRYKDAVMAYTRALAGSPEDSDALLGNRGACWLMLGEAERCAKDCEDADAFICARLAQLEAAADAAEAVEEKGRLGVSRGKLALRRANALARLGRFACARLALEDKLEQYAAVAQRDLELEQLAAARSLADEALERGEFSRALRCYAQLRDEHGVTDDAVLRVRLARCHVALRESLLHSAAASQTGWWWGDCCLRGASGRSFTRERARSRFAKHIRDRKRDFSPRY